ncbi:MAG: hypothetical protein H7338_14460 [Candidatus Sericytochromatia bacterium]|nr:hypothetical protein [Candidatus Sericytochromatia bacterium]
MTVEVTDVEALREQVEKLQARVRTLETERELLIDSAKAVYAFLIEPNPSNGDPGPWDIVDDGHPIRHAGRNIVDTLVSLGVEA